MGDTAHHPVGVKLALPGPWLGSVDTAPVRDAECAFDRLNPDHGRWVRPTLVGGAATAGVLILARRRLAERLATIQRWPVEQQATVPAALGIGGAVYAVGMGLTRGYASSRDGLIRYLGPGPAKNALGRAGNAALWAAGATWLYNAGVGYIGRANERVEPGYTAPPTSELVSGSPDSLSPFEDLGQQGRRYVTDVVTPEVIEQVLDEPAKATPIRVFVGYNSEPLYPAGRAELALEQLERTGAFDRSYLLLVSPTGTGWVDQTMIESAELMTRGDIATCAIQYGRFPSFLCMQKVHLGRSQFRLLVWGVKQRLASMPPGKRPKVLVFGESLGAWSSSDVVMYQGIKGFDHYGIDRALWFGLPGLAKWSRSGMARGASDLVPEGTVGVFDRHEQLAAHDDDARKRLRAVILMHDNDSIGALSPDLLIKRPRWLGHERGRGVPEGMSWAPLITFWQTGVDAMNAMVTVPGEFGSFGHDYRADTARFVRDAYHLPAVTDDQMDRIEAELRTLELHRADRIKASHLDAAPPAPAQRKNGEREVGGVPLRVRRTGGAKWLRSLLRKPGKAPGDIQ
jgi:Alpha/beta-hydrolase family/Alpha/beta-hydrolase family N-terminus